VVGRLCSLPTLGGVLSCAKRTVEHAKRYSWRWLCEDWRVEQQPEKAPIVWLARIPVLSLWAAAATTLLLWASPPGRLVSGWLVLTFWVMSLVVTYEERHRLFNSLDRWDGTAMSLAWVVFMAGILFFFPVVPSIFGYVGLYVGGYVLGGIVVLVLLLRVRRRTVDSILGIAIVLATGYTSFQEEASALIIYGVETRTRLVEERYSSEAEAIRLSPDRTRFEDYPDIMIDPAPPVRIMWTWWTGLLDNVGGIVSDPSHTIGDTGVPLTDDSGMNGVCIHLYDDWYYCGLN